MGGGFQKKGLEGFGLLGMRGLGISGFTHRPLSSSFFGMTL